MYNVLQMLEVTAERLPHKCAIADPDRALSFAELRDAAQAAGTWLIRADIAPRTAVAFYLEKSACAWAAMLGAVYAGGFYSVIDVRQPEGRVRDMMQTLQAKVVLTDATNAERAHELFDDAACQLALIEDIVTGDVDRQLLDSVRAQATDSDPLYANFTSGALARPRAS